jgi:drug/metabolite transporter (DMT)-like permease
MSSAGDYMGLMRDMAPPLDDPSLRLTAIGLMAAAIACFSVLDTTAKYLGTIAAVPILQIIWVRFLSHAVLSVAYFGPRGFARALHSAKPWHQMLRGVFMAGATGFNFAALYFLQLDQVATIFFLTPFIVAALAGPLLGEWVGWRRFLAICAGFSGVIFVLRPGFGGIHWAVILSFAATLSYALYNISTRYLARYDSSATTQAYTPLTGLILLAPFAAMDWQGNLPPGVWLLMLSLGVSGGLGHYLLIHAHARAPASTLAPFGYVSLLFMIVLGYVIFGDVPSAWTLLGAAIIMGSGAYLLWRETQVARAPVSSVPTAKVSAGG